MHRLFTLGLFFATAGVTACTGLDRTSTNVLSPSSTTTSATTPAPAPTPAPSSLTTPSMLGTWSSNPLAGISASSCSGFSWQVTSQTSTSIAGTFTATCASGISATGTASGTISGADVPYTVSGTATVPGFPSCPFALMGTAHVVDNDTLHIPYSGSTCLGPVSGEETLRRPTVAGPAPAPTPSPTPHPEPGPAPGPGPTESPFHVGPGPLSLPRAEQVINATADEFAGLRTARSTESEAGAAATELLRRMIWHLRRAGFEAGRQKNPSGAISGDKLALFADGGWHAVDVFYDYGAAGVPLTVIFWEVFPANPLGDEGIAD